MQTLINILVNGVVVFATAYILPGVKVSGFGAALVTAIILAVVNAIIKPVLVVLTFPITVLTLGLFVFVINALLVLLVSSIVPGFEVKGFWWAMLFSLIISVISSVLHNR